MRDFKRGIGKRWFMYLVPIGLSFLQARECYCAFEYLNNQDIIREYGTIIDYLLYATQGMTIYYFNPKQYFIIPIYWFIFEIYGSYLVAYYAFDDFTANATNIYIAARSRRSFWNSKCIWCIASIVIYYLIYYFSIFVFAILYKAKTKLNLTHGFTYILFGEEAITLDNGKILLCAVLVPFMITLSLCIGQIFLSFLTSPVISFSIISGIYIVSAYYTKWYLPGNFTMWLRSSLVYENGVNPISGLFLAILIILLSWRGGRCIFEERDIYNL